MCWTANNIYKLNENKTKPGKSACTLVKEKLF